MDIRGTASDKGEITILLVDDEETIIDTIGTLLERLGYQVISATSGEQAVKEMQEKSGAIDLVILDMLMPGMKGAEAFHCIRRIKPDIPVIIASGYNYKDQIDEVIQGGSNGFIQKPYRVADLHPQIQEILK